MIKTIFREHHNSVFMFLKTVFKSRFQNQESKGMVLVFENYF